MFVVSLGYHIFPSSYLHNTNCFGLGPVSLGVGSSHPSYSNFFPVVQIWLCNSSGFIFQRNHCVSQQEGGHIPVKTAVLGYNLDQFDPAAGNNYHCINPKKCTRVHVTIHFWRLAVH